MTTKIFLTGATGYVGGSVLHTLITAHPEYEITVLLRKSCAGFVDKYPNVKVVKGTFDDSDLLTQAASKADIVVHHGNSDHVPAVKALLAGVITRTNASLPAFYIHLGGTAIIADMRTLGELTEKIWSDMDDIDTIWSLPLNTVHRSTESLIQDAWTRHGTSLKTAVICPPHIHGKGMGPGNASSFYVPVFYKEAIKAGAAFFLNSGSNVYCRTHIQNVAQVFLKLVESAAAGGESAHWNRNGYYFVPNEELSQIQIARATGKILMARGLLSISEPKQITLGDLDKMLAGIPLPGVSRLVFAANSRMRADRTLTVLGLKGSAATFLDCLEDELLRAAYCYTG